MLKAIYRGLIFFALLPAAVGDAQALGEFVVRQHDHSGWLQTNVFVSPGSSVLSFDWSINWTAYHGQGNDNYVINDRLAIGYDNRVLGHGPYPDNGIDEVYLWSSTWHYVGHDCENIPGDGFTGHQDLDLSAVAGRTVSLWFYLDYLGNDSANDSMASFGNVALNSVPEPAAGALLLAGICVCALFRSSKR